MAQARVCKTLDVGSIPTAASKTDPLLRDRFRHTASGSRSGDWALAHRSPSMTGRAGRVCELSVSEALASALFGRGGARIYPDAARPDGNDQLGVYAGLDERGAVAIATRRFAVADAPYFEKPRRGGCDRRSQLGATG